MQAARRPTARACSSRGVIWGNLTGLGVRGASPSISQWSFAGEFVRWWQLETWLRQVAYFVLKSLWGAAGHAIARPAIWLLAGTKGERRQYRSTSIEANPAAVMMSARSRSQEHPSKTQAQGRRTERWTRRR
jgi:hypothetical protein